MDSSSFKISGNVVDVVRRKITNATVKVENGKISTVTECAQPGSRWLLPGFVDAHVPIESSMLLSAEFARAAVVHGPVAAVSDPHEIATFRSWIDVW